MSHNLEEGEVARRVGVGRRASEVETVEPRELSHRLGLAGAMARAHRAARVHAVHDFADGAERAVELEVLGKRVDDLLERRRDNVDRLTTLAMLVGEVQPLGVDQRPEDGLDCVRYELPHLGLPEAVQDHQALLGRLAHPLCAHPARDEEQLPDGRLRQLNPPDYPVPAERAGERERARTAEQRAVEIEKGGGAGHCGECSRARFHARKTPKRP